MKYAVDVMQAAVRVLKALTDKEPPNPDDVAILREFENGAEHRDLDELACDAIQRAVKRREAIRRTQQQ